MQAAEAKSALLGKTATMHVLAAEGKPEGPTLGPTVLANVLLEGHPVKVLVDTGSPITIVSIDCLLDILAKNRTDGQTVQDWKEWVEEKLKTPSLSVSNYGGGEVNIISQMTDTWRKSMQSGSIGANRCILRTTPGNRCVSPAWLLLVRGTTW